MIQCEFYVLTTYYAHIRELEFELLTIYLKCEKLLLFQSIIF